MIRKKGVSMRLAKWDALTKPHPVFLWLPRTFKDSNGDQYRVWLCNVYRYRDDAVQPGSTSIYSWVYRIFAEDSTELTLREWVRSPNDGGGL